MAFSVKMGDGLGEIDECVYDEAVFRGATVVLSVADESRQLEVLSRYPCPEHSIDVVLVVSGRKSQCPFHSTSFFILFPKPGS